MNPRCPLGRHRDGQNGGSILAESALRLGFRRFRVVAHDVVERSNLNRQNYTAHNLGHSKVTALATRLAAIDSTVEVEIRHLLIERENLPQLLDGVDVAVNCLDFDTDAPFHFDRQSQRRGIPVLHPFNFGWAGACALVVPTGPTLAERYGEDETFIDRFLDDLSRQERQAGRDDLRWLHEVARAVSRGQVDGYPQLRLGGELCTGLACRMMIAWCLERQSPPFLTPTLSRCGGCDVGKGPVKGVSGGSQKRAADR